MRQFLVLSFATLLALPAAAQYPDTVTNSDTVPPAAAYMVAPTMPVPNAVLSKTTKEEVGYDAKVKRDPYGKILKNQTKTSEPSAEAPALRNDKKLSGDSALFKR